MKPPTFCFFFCGVRRWFSQLLNQWVPPIWHNRFSTTMLSMSTCVPSYSLLTGLQARMQDEFCYRGFWCDDFPSPSQIIVLVEGSGCNTTRASLQSTNKLQAGLPDARRDCACGHLRVGPDPKRTRKSFVPCALGWIKMTCTTRKSAHNCRSTTYVIHPTRQRIQTKMPSLKENAFKLGCSGHKKLGTSITIHKQVPLTWSSILSSLCCYVRIPMQVCAVCSMQRTAAGHTMGSSKGSHMNFRPWYSVEHGANSQGSNLSKRPGVHIGR